MKSAAHSLPVCAAVRVKPQLWGDSLQAACKTTTANETFGNDRNTIFLWVYIFLSLHLLIPSSALICVIFLPFPLNFFTCYVISPACFLNPLLSFFRPSPYILNSFLPATSFLALRSLPPFPPVSCCTLAKLLLPTTYLYPGSAANN